MESVASSSQQEIPANNYLCELCDTRFATQYALIIHEEIHLTCISCNVCNSVFTCTDDLDEHIAKTHSSYRYYKCKWCHEKFKKRCELEAHATTHKQIDVFECEYCRKLKRSVCFQSRNLLCTHIRQEHPEKDIEMVTSKLFTKICENISDLRKHEVTHTQSSVSCKYCHKIFNSNFTLAIHMRDNHPQSKHMCKICKVYVTPHKLGNHVFNVHKFSYCYCCFQIYLTENKLNDHKWFETNVPNHKCPKCNKIFLRIEQLNKHTLRHKETSVMCKECNKFFMSNRAVSAHKRKCHNTYYCKNCEYSCMTRKELKSHFRVRHLSYLCNYCDKTFSQYNDLRKHKDSEHSNVNVFTCPLQCDSVFATQEAQQNHLVSDHSYHPCNECRQVYKTREELCKHKYSEHKETYFPCLVQCDLEFETQSLQQSHSVFQHSYLPCTDCQQAYETIEKLRMHKHSEHKKTFFPCLKCNEDFTALPILQQHVFFSHLSYLCNQCLLRYETIEDLRRHMYSKHSKPYFPCTTCPQRFVTQYALFIHEQTHSAYIYCYICHSTFTRSEYLDNHSATTHSGYRYKCGYCPKIFATQLQLQTHANIHTDIFFPCKYCGIIRKNKRYLTEHIRNVHKQEYLKLVTCTICNETFASLVQLQHHKSEQHFLHLCYYCDETYSTPYDLCVHNLQEHRDTYFFTTVSSATLPLLSELERNLATYSHQNPVSYDKRTDLPGTSIINISQMSVTEEIHHVAYSAPLSDQEIGQNVGSPSRVCTCNDIFTTNCVLHLHSPQPREETDTINDYPFYCFFCSLSFLTENELKNHVCNPRVT